MTARRRLVRPLFRSVAALLLALVPLTAAQAQNTYVLNAYIGNFGSNQVGIVDTALNKLIGTVTAGNLPLGIAVAADGSSAYFVNNGDSTVSVYDAALQTVIATVPVGNYPLGAALTPDGAQLWVCNYNDASISIINTVTDAVSATITGVNGCSALTFTPDGSAAYVVAGLGVMVMSTASHDVLGTYTFNGDALQVAFTPDGAQAYVTAVNSIEIIDTAHGTDTSLSVVGQNNGIAVNPDGTEAWATNEASDEVLVIDTATNAITATIPVQGTPTGIKFSADGSKAFVIAAGIDYVQVIDAASRQIVDQITVAPNLQSIGNFIATAPPGSPLAAAVLPGGRSVEIGTPATVFATIINGGSTTLDACGISIPGSSNFSFDYQTTDPATNALIGSPDTPVTIDAGGYQTYVLTFQSSSALQLDALPLQFGCDAVTPAPVTPGVNTVDLLFSPVPVADIIALAATASGNGVVTVPFSQNGAAAFAVASVNAGSGANLTLSTDTGDATLPITVSLCETNPSTGQCLAPPSATLALSFAPNATPTFSFFVVASGDVPFSPGTSRIFVRFTDAGGTSHGSTSVAVTTD
jgi:YVTN family beta-propeller protein